MRERRLLKALRAERDWTQAELSRRSGVSRDYISLLEREAREPSTRIRRALAAPFQIDPRDLRFGPSLKRERAIERERRRRVEGVYARPVTDARDPVLDEADEGTV